MGDVFDKCVLAVMKALCVIVRFTVFFIKKKTFTGAILMCKTMCQAESSLPADLSIYCFIMFKSVFDVCTQRTQNEWLIATLVYCVAAVLLFCPFLAS